ncbi:putative toxin-antitoxin system toxin component, PIN family [Lysobacter maris]|uniref:Putative toxin-antitoxin system toxin component, PIN family n=1 Tax=Marilutibacter maris TaxID=1605891 RepID=A0A508APA6_9GAMM|nr:putative toxin-antitoxin system toxin component, PIN family [Lysobacter maris]KAB8188379.1 putative toxin-antitoxin system toxin component, PIN family [Lysobacter maris]
MAPPPAPARIVLDTNAWLDLLVFADPRIAAIEAALSGGRLEAITSEPCREEWRRVLGYPLLALAPPRREALMTAFDARARIVEVAPAGAELLPQCRDRDDQKFLELALAGGARWLISRDKALLRLNRRARREGLFGILVPEAWRAD